MDLQFAAVGLMATLPMTLDAQATVIRSSPFVVVAELRVTAGFLATPPVVEELLAPAHS
jgi:hypothetical protein